jgi:large subunit ribosomal protein L10
MRTEKLQIVKDIGVILKESDFVFLISYKGLKVSEFSDLRSKLAEQDAACLVLKNRLIRKAAESEGLDDIAAIDLTGDTAVVSGLGDVSAVAKVISNFGKEFDVVSPKFGYMDGAVLSGGEVQQIADLPTREVLLSQLLGVLQAPSTNLVGILHAKSTELLNVLNAFKNTKE